VEAVAVAFSMAWPDDAVQDRVGTERTRAVLAGFRGQLYWCLGRRRDALLELADAVLCKQDRVHMAAELSLEPECRRGHGAVYDALNCGQVRIGRLRRALAGLPLSAWPDGRIRLAADVSNWLRPDAATSPDRLFCHCYARGEGERAADPGLAVLAGRGAGAGPHVVDAAAGCGPVRPGRLCDRGDRRRSARSPAGWPRLGTGRTATRTSWSSSTLAMT
jgi:hypothetical protein